MVCSSFIHEEKVINQISGFESSDFSPERSRRANGEQLCRNQIVRQSKIYYLLLITYYLLLITYYLLLDPDWKAVRGLYPV